MAQRKTLLMAGALGAVALAGCCLAGVGVAVWHYTAHAGGAGSRNGTTASTAEEKIVEAHIRRTANNPAAVEIERFGPHAFDGVWWGLSSMPAIGHGLRDATLREVKVPGVDTAFDFPDRKPAKLIRVCYRTANENGARAFCDHIFVVQEGHVTDSFANGWGDTWNSQLVPKDNGVR